MEQRNGRIDRKLQPNPEVYCHYFVYKQRPEDRILKVLVSKTDTIKEELGSLSEVVDARLRKKLDQGIRRKGINQLEKEIQAEHLDENLKASMNEELESTRQRREELKSEIGKLQDQLERSRKSIGLREHQFRSAIGCALEVLGAEQLASARASENGLEQFMFPALDQRTGADPTWSVTLDSLRVPRKRDEKLWEWRRNSPIRPIVFTEPEAIDEEVVHLHLEHRVVQRLLNRFTSQGFVHHDLSRACLAQTRDSVARVILLGRLCLYGPGAARLHEEIISVTARWVDPENRKQALSPYGRDAEAKTLELLEESLADSNRAKIPDLVLKNLQTNAPKDVSELLSCLQDRGEEYAKDAEAKLKLRAQAEAKSMREILETQRKHIAGTLAKHEKDGPIQLKLFAEEEARQLEANKRYWSKRLELIEQELKTEPDRVRQIYDIKARRIEPVGLVYLWPFQENGHGS